MDQERWERIKEILKAAEAIPVDGMGRFLAGACEQDGELRREVESLLAFEEGSQTFIEEPLWRLNVENFDLEVPDGAEGKDENLGRRIGPYRLEYLQGVGGMGRVYVARREDDYEQVVALKLMSPGLSVSGEIQDRFLNERQILAQLRHPNIAQLLDGGTTDSGEPYLVMEFVEGVPIDLYCQEKDLPIRKRLELFRQVCSAVQFAHQNLVVHRDLKPGNILVTPQGVPKLLDFGIAKLLEPGGGSPLLTVRGRGPLTPNYASPEQVREEAVTTVSDIYSLGVLLYRLLTGQAPYEVKDTGYTGMVEVICEREPTRPSAKVREMRQNAGAHFGHLRGLEQRLQGDLDAIVSKAMRKEPQHRYNSAEQLADDLRRHQEGLPVLAQHGTWAYLTGKFVRRHRVGLAILAGFIALILGSAFLLRVQLQETRWAQRQAELERERTEEVVDFLVQDVFGAADPNRSGGEEVTARELLEKGRENIQKRLEDDPVRAKLQIAMGRIYYNLEMLDEAEDLLAEARDLRQQISEGDSAELANAINALASILEKQGYHQQAEKFYLEALAMRRELFGNENSDVARTLSGLGTVLNNQGRSEEAEKVLREALDIRQQIYGPDHIEVSNSLNNLGAFLFNQGRAQEAEILFREVLRIREAEYGPEHLDVATAYNNLGKILFTQGRLEEAETYYQKSLDLRERLLGTDSRGVAEVQRNLAQVCGALGRFQECEALARQALETFGSTLAEGDWRIGDTESILGECLLLAGRLDEAEPLLQRGYETLRSTRGEEASYTREARERLERLELLRTDQKE